MIKIIAAIFLILHGLIHLFGFLVPWGIMETDDFQYKTTILAGKVDLGPTGIRIVGILWFVGAIGFVIAGIGLWMVTPWWFTLLVAVTLYSLVLCILGWPDSQFGVYINLIILVVLLFGGRFGLSFPGR
jgi:hypothetical protein